MQSIDELARQKFGEPNRRMSTRTELRFGRKGSVAVDLEHGVWFDHEAGVGGRLGAATDHDRPRSKPWQGRPPLLHDREKKRRLDEICRLIRQPEQMAAGTYLRSRGITSWPHTIMGGLMPHGLYSIATDAGGQMVALQVTYLTENGEKYEAHGATRRTYAVGENWSYYGAVRLPGRGELVLCEGVETGLSIWLATGRTVWCCLGVSNMAKISLGERKRVTVACDGDAEGSQAWVQTDNVIRALREKRRVKVARPSFGMDANDILRRDGADAVAKWIGSAR